LYWGGGPRGRVWARTVGSRRGGRGLEAGWRGVDGVSGYEGAGGKPTGLKSAWRRSGSAECSKRRGGFRAPYKSKVVPQLYHQPPRRPACAHAPSHALPPGEFQGSAAPPCRTTTPLGLSGKRAHFRPATAKPHPPPPPPHPPRLPPPPREQSGCPIGSVSPQVCLWPLANLKLVEGGKGGGGREGKGGFQRASELPQPEPTAPRWATRVHEAAACAATHPSGFGGCADAGSGVVTERGQGGAASWGCGGGPPPSPPAPRCAVRVRAASRTPCRPPAPRSSMGLGRARAVCGREKKTAEGRVVLCAPPHRLAAGGRSAGRLRGEEGRRSAARAAERALRLLALDEPIKLAAPSSLAPPQPRPHPTRAAPPVPYGGYLS
jgi:hypothetical protein